MSPEHSIPAVLYSRLGDTVIVAKENEGQVVYNRTSCVGRSASPVHWSVCLALWVPFPVLGSMEELQFASVLLG